MEEKVPEMYDETITLFEEVVPPASSAAENAQNQGKCTVTPSD